MSRFYITPEAFKKDLVEITGEDHKHISKVLRLSVDDQIELYDGDDHKATGIIKEIDPKVTYVNILDRSETGSENKIAEITLFQGYPKQGKLETIVQKNTELGVTNITPFFAHRSIPKPTKNEDKKTTRLNRVAYEASKQSGRGRILKVNSPISFKELNKELGDFDLILLPYENEKTTSLKKVLNQIGTDQRIKIAVIIGPEGGFEAEEVEELIQNGATSVSLGPRILRTETAGMATVAQINYALEDNE